MFWLDLSENKGGSPNKKTNFLRNFNKPISQNPEAGNLSIDVKNISIRQVNLNYSRMKETQPDGGKNVTPPIQNKSLLLAQKDQRKATIDNKSGMLPHEVINC